MAVSKEILEVKVEFLFFCFLYIQSKGEEVWHLSGGGENKRVEIVAKFHAVLVICCARK